MWVCLTELAIICCLSILHIFDRWRQNILLCHLWKFLILWTAKFHFKKLCATSFFSADPWHCRYYDIIPLSFVKFRHFFSIRKGVKYRHIQCIGNGSALNPHFDQLLDPDPHSSNRLDPNWDPHITIPVMWKTTDHIQSFGSRCALKSI
jgi:hypothetical protein